MAKKKKEEEFKLLTEEQEGQLQKKEGVLILGNEKDERLNFVCAITDDLTSKLDASKIVKEIGKKLGGGGGGTPYLATAGTRNSSDVKAVIKSINKYIIEKIS